MVDIFTKKSGPRREDVAAKRVINENWPTIRRLADQISDGGYTRSRQAIAKSKEEPKLDNLNIHILGGTSKVVDSKPQPVVRMSRNNRVVVMDANTGSQLEFLGEFRFQEGQKYFVLATAANGYFAAIDEVTQRLLEDLDGVVIETDDIQDAFTQVITSRLDL